MAGVLRPSGCHGHQGIIRRAVSVIQGAGKSSAASRARVAASTNRPGLIRTLAIRSTTPPRTGGMHSDSDPGQGAQKKQGSIGIIKGVRGTQHYAAARPMGPVFFQWKSGFSVDSRARMVKGIGRRTSAAGGPAAIVPVTAALPVLRSLPPDPLMATAERSFLMPCACAARVPVTAGQAGGRVRCPACGREIDVPRFRELAAFAVEQPRTVAGPASGMARGLVVAGMSLAVIAALLAIALVPVGGRFFRQPPPIALIREAVAGASLADIHAAWQSMARSGVGRPATAEELRIQQFAAHAAGVARLLWGASGVGLVVALAGAAVAAARRSSGAGPRP